MIIKCDYCKEEFDLDDYDFQEHNTANCIETDEDRFYNKVGMLSMICFIGSVFTMIIVTTNTYQYFGGLAILVGVLASVPLLLVTILIQMDRILSYKKEIKVE